MPKINKLQPENPANPGKPGRKTGVAAVFNAGLEQALAEADGNIAELARRTGLTSGTLVMARKLNVSSRVAIALFEHCRIKLSKSLGRDVRCQHCHKII